MEEGIKKEYELAILIDAESAEADIDKLLSDKDLSAEVFHKDPARLMTLAYPIKKHTAGVLLIYQLSLLTENVDKLEKGLRFQPHVLRSMIVTPPIKKSSFRRDRVEEAAVAGRKESVRSLSPEISSNELLTKTLETLEKDES